MKHASGSKASRRPGRPVEIFVWRVLEATPRGRRRVLAMNVTAASDLRATLYSLGVGRYRVEWRDRRRFVEHVEAWEVYGDGAVGRVPPMGKKRARKVPPPRHVAPGTPPWAVPNAPVVGTSMPAPVPPRW